MMHYHNWSNQLYVYISIYHCKYSVISEEKAILKKILFTLKSAWYCFSIVTLKISVYFRGRWFILIAAFQRPEGPSLSRRMASEPQSRRSDQRKCKQVQYARMMIPGLCVCMCQHTVYWKNISVTRTNFLLTCIVVMIIIKKKGPD